MFLNAVKNITFIWNIESGTSSRRYTPNINTPDAKTILLPLSLNWGKRWRVFRCWWQSYPVIPDTTGSSKNGFGTPVDRPVSRSIDGVETGYWCWIRLRSSYTFIDDTDGTGVSFNWRALNIHVQMKVMFLNAVKNITFIWNIESGTSSMKVYSQHQYPGCQNYFTPAFLELGKAVKGFSMLMAVVSCDTGYDWKF